MCIRDSVPSERGRQSNSALRSFLERGLGFYRQLDLRRVRSTDQAPAQTPWTIEARKRYRQR
eukprot:9256598-Alexandrium_andersonii.AAC.1